jgi:SAM-dependent methyltransferase
MLPTKILPRSLLDTVKRRRPIYYVGRKARFALGSTLGARYVEGLGGKAHYNDFMLRGFDKKSVEKYRAGALEFVGILGQALTEAGRSWGSVSACLEVGCGYGRIVRELRQETPAETISVCDVIDEAARFTASEFGVRRVGVLPDAVEGLKGQFDLVYLLSVYTHLRLDLIEANLAAVAATLKPGGVVVFTTHGDASAAMAEIYEQYWLDKARVLAELESTGFYYERYPYYYDDYGLTWFKQANVLAMVERVAPSLQFVACHPAGLEQHQDVYVYRKA